MTTHTDDAPPPLAVRCSVSRPASSVGREQAELALRVDVQVTEAASAPSASGTLALIPIGQPCDDTRLRLEAPLRRIGALVPEGVRVRLPTGAVTAGSTGDALDRALDRAASRPLPTVAEGLELGRALAGDDGRGTPDGPVAVWLVLAGPTGETGNEWGEPIEALRGRGVVIDALALHPTVDLGPLLRMAAMSGGVAAPLEDGAAGDAVLRDRLTHVMPGRRVDARVGFDFFTGLDAGHVFRLDPRPIYLGHLALTETERTLRLDPGPLLESRPASFLFTLRVPRRRVGRYRLAACSMVQDDGQARLLGYAEHEWTEDLAAAYRVDAAVAAALQRAEPTAWIEEAAEAYAAAEHREVATTLERLLRRFAELGTDGGVDLTSTLRARFLRTGTLLRSDVNQLRALAAS